MKFLHYIGATNRYGDEDVWSFTLNSDQPHVEYVNPRDIENGLIFSGFVNTYSENESFREILLIDAKAYDHSTGDELFASPHMYISRPKNNITMDFPYEKES